MYVFCIMNKVSRHLLEKVRLLLRYFQRIVRTVEDFLPFRVLFGGNLEIFLGQRLFCLLLLSVLQCPYHSHILLLRYLLPPLLQICSISALSLHKKQSSTYNKYACGCFLCAPSIYTAYLQKAYGRGRRF